MLQMLQKTTGRVHVHSVMKAGMFPLLKDKLPLVSNVLNEGYNKDLSTYHPGLLHFITHFPSRSEVYMTLQEPHALFLTSRRQDSKPALLFSCSDQQLLDSHCMRITPETLISVSQHTVFLCSLYF